MRLFLISASVAGLIISAGHSLAAAVSPHEAVIGLVVTVDAGGGVRATGQMPREFPLADLKKQIPEIDLSGGVANDGIDAGNAFHWRGGHSPNRSRNLCIFGVWRINN